LSPTYTREGTPTAVEYQVHWQFAGPQLVAEYLQWQWGTLGIRNSQQFKRLDIQECRMICGEQGKNETALGLRVWSRPIEVNGEVFTVFSVVDISDEKRRKMLERIFSRRHQHRRLYQGSGRSHD
jgi:hypothetical protein